MNRYSFLAVLLIAGGVLQAEDWPRFRGPSGSAVAADASSIPTNFSANANLAWKTPLPGPGASSPIIVGGRAFVTCYSGYGADPANIGEMEDLMRHLVCIDMKTGKILWTKDVEPALPEDPFSGAGVPAHGYASHTPVSDGKHVFAFFGKSGVHAFDLDGKKLWDAKVGMESDPPKWGSSSSPIVFENTVIVVAAAESQSIIGFDKESGKELWRQEAEGLDNMWGTPTLVKVDEGRTDLVMFVAKEIWGLDPANGELRWMAGDTKSDSAYSSLAIDGKRVFALSGGRTGGGSIAVDVGGKGDVSKSNVVWRGRDTASFQSPVFHNGKLYAVSKDVVTVIDAKTGKHAAEKFRLKGFAEGRLDYPSPVVVGDRLFSLNGRGQMFVLSLGDEPKQIAVNKVTTDEKEVFYGTPAVADGQMLLRSSKHLYCVADKGETVSEEDMKLAKASASSGGGGNRRGNRFDPAAYFANLDKDSDGKLTKEELKASTMIPGDRLIKLDKDEDEAVSKEEWANLMSLFRGRGGRGGGGGYGGDKDSRPDRPQRPKPADKDAA